MTYMKRPYRYFDLIVASHGINHAILTAANPSIFVPFRLSFTRFLFFDSICLILSGFLRFSH